MNILLINYELPPIGGGGGRATWQIALRLVKMGHVVRVLTSQFGDLPLDEMREGVFIRRIPVARKRPDRASVRQLVSFMVKSLKPALHWAESLRPDVVCTFFAIPGGPAAWKVWRRLGIPYVLAVRGSDIPRSELAQRQRLHFFTKPFIRRLLHDAAAVTAVSGALRGAVLALDPELSVAVIPNGVDTGFFAPPPGIESKEPEPELLYVGRLREFKGVQHIIRALPGISQELGRPARLTVVGDGPYLKALDSLVERQRAAGAQSHVRFVGWMAQEELRNFYQQASVIILPSLVEGHPNVLLEGMACGLPCVASDVPGIREVVTPETGFLVAPENPDAIQRAVVKLFVNPGVWRSMSRAALARANEFDWQSVAQRYEEVLARAAEGAAQS